MTRLQRFFSEQRHQKGKLLSIYLTAGYPQADATLPLLDTLVAAGADMIELGVPFSDPLADGPTIQMASQQALDGGMTLLRAMDILRQFKQKHKIPMLLMGYSNPFHHFGWDALIQLAATVGCDGFIVPDLPLEESGNLQRNMRQMDMDLIYLVSPNTPAQRVDMVNQRGGGFIYAVSLTGVTGARQKLPDDTADFLKRLRKQSDLPILVGFGISNRQTATAMAAHSNGVIIGSAVINCIAESKDMKTAQQHLYTFIRTIKEGLSGGH